MFQFQAALQECLTMAEIGDYVDCNPEPGSSSTLLGLTREEIQRQNPYKKVFIWSCVKYSFINTFHV